MSRGPTRFRAGHLDANHLAVAEAFRACGARVLDLSKVGGGCPDLLVYVSTLLFLIEVKTPKGKLKPSQEDFHAEWPVIVVREVEMVPTIVQQIKSVANLRPGVFTESDLSPQRHAQEGR